MVNYNPIEETRKRLDLAQRVTENYYKKVEGIVLVGSVAYGSNEFVTDKSDLDILIITSDLEKIVQSNFVTDTNAKAVLKYRYFDGYMFKDKFNDVDLSIHLFDHRSFEVICGLYNGELRLFRQQQKEIEAYKLYNFEGECYDYQIKILKRTDGTTTIKVPMSFIHEDKYHLGIHRDKLLSNPIILFEEEGCISKALEKLWEGTIRYLRDEAMRKEGIVDLNKRNVLNALSRKERISKQIKDMITARTVSELLKICSPDAIITQII